MGLFTRFARSLALAFRSSPAARPARRRTPPALLRLEALEDRSLLSVTLNPINDVQVTGGKSTFVPAQGTSSLGVPVSYSVSSSDAQLTASVLEGGRSIDFNVSGTDSTGAPFTGDMVVRLFENLTPATSAHILGLAESGFYNGVIFHRVIPGFVAQGGDPTGTGSGGSGHPIDDEYNTQLTYTSVAILAMANSGPDTGDSQFFLTDPSVTTIDRMAQHLNFTNAPFGQLVKGADVLAKIMSTPTDSSDRPTSPVTINSATVFTDTQDGVMQLTPAAGFTGTATVTVTATDGTGTPATQTFTVTGVADTQNGNPVVDRPFLGPVQDQQTKQNTPVSFTLTATNLDKIPITFAAGSATDITSQPANATVSVDQATGTVTVVPNAGFTGTINLLVGVKGQSGNTALDTQKVTVTVAADIVTPTNLALSPASQGSTFNDTSTLTSDAPTFTVTAEAGRTVRLLVNGTVAATATETSPGQFSATLAPGSLKLGNNSITATASDGTTTSAASAALTVNYAPSFQQVYTVPGAPGTSVQLTFTQTFSQTAFANEAGVYVVDDLAGTVGGTAPTSPTYGNAALSSSSRQTLFTSGSGNVGASQTLTFTAGQKLAFYIVQNSTTAQFLAASQLAGGARPDSPPVFFSVDTANSDTQVHEQSVYDLASGVAQYSWEDLTSLGDADFNDMVFTVTPAGTTAVQPATTLQVTGATDAPTAVTVTAQAATKSAFNATPTTTQTVNGEVGLILTDDNTGKIGTLNPGDAGYLSVALGSLRRVPLFGAGDAVGVSRTLSLPGGQSFAFYYIPNGTAAGVLGSNPNNAGSGSPVAFFSIQKANPDSVQHFRFFSPEAVRQQTPGTSQPLQVHASGVLNAQEKDFDDILFSITNAR